MFFNLVLQRIAESDLGEEFSLSGEEYKKDKLEKAKSVLNTEVSESLIGAAFTEIFDEVKRYISQLPQLL